MITTKPSVNQMVDSMYALARAWFLRQVQELRVRAQPERQFPEFEVARCTCSRQHLTANRLAGPSRRAARRSGAPRPVGLRHNGAVAQLASRPRRLAIVVQMQGLFRQQASARAGMSPIRLIMAQCPRGACRPAAGRDRAHVVLELAGHRALRWSSARSCGRGAPSRWRPVRPRRTKNSMASTPT